MLPLDVLQKRHDSKRRERKGEITVFGRQVAVPLCIEPALRRLERMGRPSVYLLVQFAKNAFLFFFLGVVEVAQLVLTSECHLLFLPEDEHPSDTRW